MVKKYKKNTSNTPAIKDNAFKYGKPKHVAQFDKSKKAIVNYIQMSKERESANVATIIEYMMMVEIPIPPQPPQILNPVQADPPAVPPTMINNVAMSYIWQGELKLIASRQVALNQGLIQAYAIIWDQCLNTMKGKLKHLPVYQQI